MALWRSEGAAWTEFFSSGLVPEAAEAQLRAIARYNPREGPPTKISSTTCSGPGISHGSFSTTGWSNSSAGL